MARPSSSPSLAGSGRATLPIDAHLPEIRAAVLPGCTLLLQAPPGAGKTTRVPLALLRDPAFQGRTLMVEPRRLAATAAARRLAAGLGQPVGQEVGYRVRLEARTSAATRLEVLTGGVLLRRIQNDPALEGVDCVILDEFHERGTEADLALALLRQARTLLRPDLCLVLMSATLDLAPLAEQLDQATVITTPGRSHPVEVMHQPPRRDEALQQQVVRALEQNWIHERHNGETVLVFLPGRRELEAARAAIQATPWGLDPECRLLHGQLSLAAQEEVISPARDSRGKVVLATSIAESSLTLEGVRLVIDSGLRRVNRFDPATGMNGLITMPASQASAEQRRGRAGRLAPGRCLRLWAPGEHRRRAAFDPPELLHADPLPMALELALWGTPDGSQLPWLAPPPAGPLRRAVHQLQQLDAVDADGRITSHGRAMANLGLHPRLAHMLLQAESRGWRDQACALAVLLEEQDPLDRQQDGADLLRRLDWLQGLDPPHLQASRPERDGRDFRQRHLKRLEARLRRQLGGAWMIGGPPRSGREEPPGPEPHSRDVIASRLISWAYPERIALSRGRKDGSFLLRNGHGARLHPEDPLASVDALAIARVEGQGKEADIRLAVPLAREILEEIAVNEAETRRTCWWDLDSQRVRCERTLRLGALTLERSPWRDPDPAAVTVALLEAVRRMGVNDLPWCPSSRQLQQRLSLARRRLGPPWPDRSWGWLESHLEDWLAPHLSGLRSRQDLLQLDMKEVLWGKAPWTLRRDLDRLLPQDLEIPSGRRVRLDYSDGEPFVAAKIQEFFGSTVTPTVLDGQLPVTLHLLSPAGRPAAITRDLGRFWSDGYLEVRRDLRGRYPKHPWPENPYQAQATRLTKARLKALGVGEASEGGPTRKRDTLGGRELS